MLIVLGVSLDRDGIKFSLGDNDDLSVEVDAASMMQQYSVLTYHNLVLSQVTKACLILFEQ